MARRGSVSALACRHRSMRSSTSNMGTPPARTRRASRTRGPAPRPATRRLRPTVAGCARREPSTGPVAVRRSGRPARVSGRSGSPAYRRRRRQAPRPGRPPCPRPEPSRCWSSSPAGGPGGVLRRWLRTGPPRGRRPGPTRPTPPRPARPSRSSIRAMAATTTRSWTRPGSSPSSTTPTCRCCRGRPGSTTAPTTARPSTSRSRC